MIDLNLEPIAIPCITITKDQLQQIVNSNITNNEWNTFAHNVGCIPIHADITMNDGAFTENLIEQFRDTGIWPDHTQGSLFLSCFPSFDELETYLQKYNVVLTNEIWEQYYEEDDN